MREQQGPHKNAQRLLVLHKEPEKMVMPLAIGFRHSTKMLHESDDLAGIFSAQLKNLGGH